MDASRVRGAEPVGRYQLAAHRPGPRVSQRDPSKVAGRRSEAVAGDRLQVDQRTRYMRALVARLFMRLKLSRISQDGDSATGTHAVDPRKLRRTAPSAMIHSSRKNCARRVTPSGSRQTTSNDSCQFGQFSSVSFLAPGRAFPKELCSLPLRHFFTMSLQLSTSS